MKFKQSNLLECLNFISYFNFYFQSNLLEWNFKPEIKIGIKTIKTEIKTIILESEWKLKRNKKEKKIILEI